MRIIILNILFVLFFSFYSISQEIGRPFIKNYSPNDYNGKTQIWDIVQDNRGVMYFGTNNCILEFDGNTWRKIFLPGKNTTVRSMDIDSMGTIYVGSIGEFGYLEPDITGNLMYISLSQQLDSIDRNFSDVWNTVVLKNGVYFNTIKALYRFDGLKIKDNIQQAQIKIWYPKETFFVMNKVNDEIRIVEMGKGLFTIQNDSLLPVYGNENLTDKFIWLVLPYEKDKYLIGTENEGLIIFNPYASDTNNIVSKSPYFIKKYIEKTDKFLSENQLYHGALLNDSTYAFATIRSGIVIVNNKGKIIQHINKKNGLPSQTVHHLFKDKKGGLWAALAYGISHIETNSPITIWDENSGLVGSIYDVIRNNKTIYTNTNLGLFYLENNKFNPVNELTGRNAIQCFGSVNFELPDTNEQLLLVSANLGVWEVRKHKAKRICNLTSYELFQSITDPYKVWLHNEYHLYYLEYKNKKWQKSDTIASFSSYPESICEDINGNIWLLVDEKPVCVKNINFTDNTKKIINYDDLSDISEVNFYSIQNFENKILFTTNKGLYYFDFNNKFIKDTVILDNLFYSSNNEEIYQFSKIGNNRYLLQTRIDEKEKIKLVYYNKNQIITDSIRFKRIPNFDFFYTDGDSIMWVVSSKALYQFDLKINKNYDIKTFALNRKVTINSDSTIFSGTFYKKVNNRKLVDYKQLPELIPVIDYKFNDITFEYSLPDFDNENNNEFCYFLDNGNKNNKWSNWSKETKKEYTNLFEGNYTFKVKSRNIYGIESEMSEYSFKIHPPWYRTILVYIIYIILFIAFVWAIVKLNTMRLIKDKERLEGIVLERTAEIMQQKEEIHTQAEHLKDANKQISAKNEVLKEQKEEIEVQADNLKEANSLLIGKNNEIENIAKKLRITNKKITDSIEYAKQIQKAILPSDKQISNILNEYFILFKPKDIVSGDFYWIKKIKDFIIIVVADCTGHGVPGAFMSMLGIAFLNEIVSKSEITQTNQVLDEIREQVKKSLNQKGEIHESHDGMDMAICAVNSKTMIMEYAGANNPMYIIRKNEGKPELIQLEPDIMPIGIYLKEKPFRNKTIQLEKDDILYFYTDGYIDQFSGKNENKFLKSRFDKLLLKIFNKPMAEQKEILDKTIRNWKGNSEQIDDITVMGVKI